MLHLFSVETIIGLVTTIIISAVFLALKNRKLNQIKKLVHKVKSDHLSSTIIRLVEGLGFDLEKMLKGIDEEKRVEIVKDILKNRERKHETHIRLTWRIIVLITFLILTLVLSNFIFKNNYNESNTSPEKLKITQTIALEQKIKNQAAFELGYFILLITLAEEQADTSAIFTLQQSFQSYLNVFGIDTKLILTSKNYIKLARMVYNFLNTSSENNQYLAYFELSYYFSQCLSKYQNRLSFKFENIEKALYKVDLPSAYKKAFSSKVAVLKQRTEVNPENTILYEKALEELNKIRDYLKEEKG